MKNSLNKIKIHIGCKALLTLALLLVVTTLSAQVQVKADTTSIRIGEQIKYELSAPFKTGVVFSKLALDSTKKVEIVREFPIDTLKDRLYKKYLLTSFDSGSYVIPAQDILIQNQHYFTDSLLINVGTVAVDTTKQGLFPIKPIYKAPLKAWQEYLWMLWWVLGVLALIFIIWWFAFRNKKGIQWKPKKVLTPYETALDQLKSLDEKNLLGQQKVKEYYTELTDIFRNYIEQDLKIAAMEITSVELLAIIKKTNKYKKLGISRDHLENLTLFLKHSDLVKFAKAKPETNEIQQDRIHAEGLLSEIKTVVSKPQLDENGQPIVEMQKEEIIQKTSYKKRRNAVIIGVLLMLFVLGGTAWYFGIQYAKDKIIGHPSLELLEGKWYKANYGYPAITMETPVVLKPMQIPLPPEAQQMLKSISFFEYGSYISGFTIVVSTGEYSEMIEPNEEGAVNGAIQNMKAQKGISDVQYKVEDASIDGTHCKRIYGKLNAENKVMVFNTYMIMEDHFMRQIIIARSKEDKYAEKIENRIINSIHLEKPAQD